MAWEATHAARKSDIRLNTSLLFFLELSLVFGLATWRALTSYLYDDCGWFVYSIGRMLDGGRLYVDIMEVNPPLFFWLMTPPIALARWTGGDPQLFYKLWTLLVVGASVAFSHAIARRLFAEQRPARLLTLAVALVLALYPSWDLGQREHMSLVLAMPYILLQALRREGRHVPVWIAVLAGAMAGLGFSIKPYILAVPLMLELWVQWGRWSLRRLLRMENLLVAATGATYLAVVWFFVPAYFENLLPLALATYHAGHRITWAEFLDEVFFMNLRLHIFFFVIAAGLIHLLRKGIPDGRTARLVVTLMAAATGYEVSWFLQGTRWDYLPYPPMSLAIVTVIVVLPHVPWPWRRTGTASGAGVIAGSLMLAAALLSFAFALAFSFPYHLQMDRQLKSGMFTPEVRSFYIFTMRMSEAFPFANELGLQWASRYPYLWPLPAIIKAREKGQMTPELRQAEAKLLSSVVEDLRRYRPDLIQVNIDEKQNFIRRPFDYLAYFSQAPGFAEIMRDYRLVKRTKYYLFFRRVSDETTDQRRADRPASPGMAATRPSPAPLRGGLE